MTLLKILFHILHTLKGNQNKTASQAVLTGMDFLIFKLDIGQSFICFLMLFAKSQHLKVVKTWLQVLSFWKCSSVFIFSDYSNSTNTEVFAMPRWLPGQPNTDQYTHFCVLSSFLSVKIKKKIQLLTLQPGNWKHPFALPALLASVQPEEWQSWNRHKTRNLNTDEAITVHSVADDHPQRSHWRSCIFSSLQYSYKK